MGTTDNSLHIYAPASSQGTTLQQVTADLASILSKLGYELSEAAHAEHTISLISDPASSWISVLHDFKALAELPPALSQSTGMVIHLSVFDSDVVEIVFYQNGQKVDRFSDWANYDNSPRKVVGDATLWQPVLPSSATPDALQAAWQTDPADYPFGSEGILYRVMDLLQIDRWRFSEMSFIHSHPSSVQITSLSFRYAKPLPYDQFAKGLPRLERSGYSTRIEAQPKQQASITFSIMNYGGSSQGIEIQINGTAITQNLIEPIGLIIEGPFDHRMGKIAATPERQNNTDGTVIYRFILPDYPVRAGFADWSAINALPFHLRDMFRETKMQHYFAIVMKAEAKGTGQLEIHVSALDNSDTAAIFTVDVKINP